MDTNLEQEKDEIIVIADECGDSMWNAVLAQDVQAGEVKPNSKTTPSLFQSAGAVQTHDAGKN